MKTYRMVQIEGTWRIDGTSGSDPVPC